MERLIQRLRIEWQGRLDIEARPNLTSFRRRLESATGRGSPVHAGSDLRRRRVILDSGLFRHPRDLRRVLAHELFHFAWARLGNPLRRGFEDLLRGELDEGARGELGWSAEMRKNHLTWADCHRRSRRWRDYACESFCDTAAWRASGGGRRGEFTLGHRWSASRAAWFRRNLDGRPLPV